MTRLLVTGASGFVGAAVCAGAAERGMAVVRASRAARATEAGWVSVGEVGPDTDWAGALRGAEVVVHLAARTHVLREDAPNPLAAYRRVNVLGTRRLAEQAALAGVRRFVFVSSIKVNGEETTGTPFREGDPPRPEDAYGQSKLEAEAVLRRVATGAGMEVVIVRPPLVHGPGVGGNLRRLLQLVARGIPLPLASIENRRSLVGRDNLAALLLEVATHPAAAGRLFLAADEPALSTPELVRQLAAGIGVTARLWPAPVGLVRGALSLLGGNNIARRLTASLVVDGSLASRTLGWRPPLSLEEGLATMARWYRDTGRAD